MQKMSCNEILGTKSHWERKVVIGNEKTSLEKKSRHWERKFVIGDEKSFNIPRSRPRLMKRQCSTKMCYEKTILDSFEL